MVYFPTMPSRPELYVSADALRSQRLRALLTPQELADRAKLHVQTIKDLEANDKAARTTTVRKIALALGCDASEFSQVQTEEVAS